MKTVKIVKGSYGSRPPVERGGTVELTDKEAKRLVDLGVAEYAGGKKKAKGDVNIP